MIAKIDLRKTAVFNRINGWGSSQSKRTIGLICNVLNLDKVKVVANKMNRIYNHVEGRKAYDRRMLIGGELFCQEKGISTYSAIEREYEDNIVLFAFSNFKAPKYTVISSFLKELNEIWIKQIFYIHLVLMNDYDPLNFDKIFIDGTDVIANASINYTINQKQVDAARLLHHWGLLHNGNEDSKLNRTVAALRKKQDEYKNKPEICELIKTALKRPQIYTKKTFRKIRKNTGKIN